MYIMNDKGINIKEHFKVPEGYFENLSSSIMAKIPEQSGEPLQVTKRPIAVSKTKSRLPYYAASIAASLLIVVVAVTMHKDSQYDKHLAEAEIGKSAEQYAYTVDEAADYVMFDSQDIHDMLTE